MTTRRVVALQPAHRRMGTRSSDWIARGLCLWCSILLLGPFRQGQAQERNPFATGRPPSDSVASRPAGPPPADTAAASARARLAEEFKGRDSVVYRFARGSRLQVKTGKAGL